MFWVNVCFFNQKVLSLLHFSLSLISVSPQVTQGVVISLIKDHLLSWYLIQYVICFEWVLLSYLNWCCSFILPLSLLSPYNQQRRLSLVFFEDHFLCWSFIQYRDRKSILFWIVTYSEWGLAIFPQIMFFLILAFLFSLSTSNTGSSL